MNQKRVKNLSFTFKNDFFDEIKSGKEDSSLNLTLNKTDTNQNIKYKIKSSLFLDKSESINDLEASRFSRIEVSTKISDAKRNDCSYFSKMDDAYKSGIVTFLIIK